MNTRALHAAMETLRDPQQAPRLSNRAFVALLIIGFAVLMYLGRSQWFFGDEWAFIVGRREMWADGHYVDFFMRPHNEHWVGVPAALYCSLFAVVGLHSYRPYLALALVAHLAIVVLIRVLLRGLGFGPWTSVGAACLVLFLGAGGENLVWGFQITFLGAIAFGLGQLVLADHDGAIGWRDVAGLLCAVLALASAGTAVSMVIVTAVTLALRGRWRSAVLHAAVPGLVFAGWYAGWGHDAPRQPAPHQDQIPPYVYRGITSALEGLTQLPGLGALLVVGVAATAAFIGAPAVRRTAPAWGAVCGAVAMYLIGASARAASGPDQAASSRYVYIGAVMLLPAVAIGVRLLAQHMPSPGILVLVAWTWALVAGGAALVAEERSRFEIGHPTKLQILAAAELAQRPGINLAVRPEPTFNPDVTMLALRDLVRDGDLDTGQALPPSAVVAAEAQVLLAVDAVPVGTAPNGRVQVIDRRNAAVDGGGDGCVTVEPTESAPPEVALQIIDGGGLIATPGSGGDIGVTLRSSDGTAVAPRRDYGVAGGGPVRIVVDVPSSSVVLRFPTDEPTELCGVGL